MANTFPNMIRTCTVNGRPCGCAPTEACRMVSATQYDTGPAPLPDGASDLVHRVDKKRCADCKASQCAGPDHCRKEWDAERAKRDAARREPLLPRNSALVIEPVANGFTVRETYTEFGSGRMQGVKTLVFQDLGHSDGTEDASLLSFLKHHFAAQEDR